VLAQGTRKKIARMRPALQRLKLFVPVLLLLVASASRAAPDPCAYQEQELAAKGYGTPEYFEAQKWLNVCRASVEKDKKATFPATRDAWATSLDKLPNGGWKFLMVSEDGTYAVFGSLRHAIREGNVVSVWLRFENREQQINGAGASYKSLVERRMYDCARVTAKAVSSTYYVESNLSGVGSSSTYDEKKLAWDPVIPGSVGDSLLEWACNSTPRAAPPPKAP
jgi:hypothetical protein